MEIAGTELLLIAVVILVVIGPQRLPETLRTLGLWLGRLRRSFLSVKTEIEKEIGMDEIRRQLHNEAVMEEMRKIEEEVKSSVDPALSPTEAPPLYTNPEDAKPTADKTETTDAESTESETSADPEPITPEPTPPTPRSEAELEALHEARAKQAAREKRDNPPVKEADSG